ncbi:MAG: pseudouridine synthase [Candidatus Dormibacteria bacterium]
MSAAAPERLNRFLARRGVASRRAADDLIAAGRVTVNGLPGRLGTQVDPERDQVRVDTIEVRPAAALTLMLNKPPGYVTTRRDPGGRRTVMQLVPRAAGLVPVGRLDADSRGLLLLTTDGELAHRVSHPRYGVRKRYLVRLDRRPTDDEVRRLAAGVELDDGPARAVATRRGRRPDELEMTMAEGRKREVRRMCATLGMEVRDLLRLAVGPLELGDLEEGTARQLTAAEEHGLRAAVELDQRGRSAADG